MKTVYRPGSLDDGSRVYVGRENGDGIEVIDPAVNKVVARIGGGQAPQALVYLSNIAAPGSADNLVPRVDQDAFNLPLKSHDGTGRGFTVVRQLGVVLGSEVSVFGLKPATRYAVCLGQEQAGALLTDAKGNANASMIGAARRFAPSASAVSGRSAGPGGTGGLLVMRAMRRCSRPTRCCRAIEQNACSGAPARV